MHICHQKNIFKKNLVKINNHLASLNDLNIEYVQTQISKELHKYINFAIKKGFLYGKNKKGKKRAKILKKAFIASFVRYYAKKLYTEMITKKKKYFDPERTYLNPSSYACLDKQTFSMFSSKRISNIFSDPYEFGAIINSYTLDKLLRLNLPNRNTHFFEKLISASKASISPITYKHMDDIVSELQINKAAVTLWKELHILYLTNICNKYTDVGIMELDFLATQLGINLKIENDFGQFTFGKVKPISISLYCKFNLDDFGHEISSFWSALYNNPPINPTLSVYFNKFELCYKFLDIIYDKFLYTTINMITGLPRPISDYINDFFKGFRTHFYNEASQLYGWRGLRNWVTHRDAIIRESNRGEGLNHTTSEFHILTELIEKNKGLQYLIASVATMPTPLSIANFSYTTSNMLVETRARYARYLKFAGDPKKFDMQFHDKDYTVKEKSPSLNPGPILKAKRKRKDIEDTYEGLSARKFSLIVKWALVSIFGLLLCIGLIIISRFFNDKNDNFNFIVTAVVNTPISIFVLFLGMSICALYDNNHNFVHDKNELKKYQIEIAKIIFRTVPDIYNLFEKIEEESINSAAKVDGEARKFVKKIISKLKRDERYTTIPLPLSHKKILFSIFAKLFELENKHKVQDIITTRVNEASGNVNLMEDICTNIGAQLQQKRMRRHFVQWEAGKKIEKRIYKLEIKNYLKRYGFLSKKATPTSICEELKHDIVQLCCRF